MRLGVVRCLVLLAVFMSAPALGHAGANKAGKSKINFSTRQVPSHVILVKGAWSSSDDPTTPVPEDASLRDHVFRDKYFGITYRLPTEWIEQYAGPPPSDSGRYVLAQISRPDDYQGDARGNILITAQDLFFTTLPASNALQLINYAKDHLQADYKLEPHSQSAIDDRTFATLAYWSPIAQLHWYILTTEIRCHAVEFIFMNRDPEALATIVLQAQKMSLPSGAGPTDGAGGGSVPTCVANYANGDNVIDRVDPVFTEQRFNPVPVRIIIGKDGSVKHIHFLSAFPDQTHTITDALRQWKFKPYLREGRPAEVETGIMFGRSPHPKPALPQPQAARDART